MHASYIIVDALRLDELGDEILYTCVTTKITQQCTVHRSDHTRDGARLTGVKLYFVLNVHVGVAYRVVDILYRSVRVVGVHDVLNLVLQTAEDVVARFEVLQFLSFVEYLFGTLADVFAYDHVFVLALFLLQQVVFQAPRDVCNLVHAVSPVVFDFGLLVLQNHHDSLQFDIFRLVLRRDYVAHKTDERDCGGAADIYTYQAPICQYAQSKRRAAAHAGAGILRIARKLRTKRQPATI